VLKVVYCILQFAKDGTAVGSIGNDTGNLTINSASTGILQTVGTSRYYWDDAQIYPANTNSKNLGHPSYQFKDAYLSGGIHLGGTGSANKLDDYEEGTFTPSIGFNNNTSGITFQSTPQGLYTKVGRKVTVIISFVLTNKGSNSGNFTCSLPFGSHASGQGSGVMGYNYSWTDGDKARGFTFQVHSGVLYMMNADSGGFATNAEFTNTTYISGITVTYFTT